MKKRMYLVFIGLLSLVTALSSITGTASATTGDNPLTTSLTWSGRGNVIVDVVAFDYVSDPSGTFVISGIPDGSTIETAYVYGTEWGYSPGEVASLTLGEYVAGSISPIADDSAGVYDLATYRWDVTSVISGNGNYAFSMSGLETCFGVGLVVIYSNTAELPKQITLNDGSENLKYSSSTTVFDALPGNGTLMIFTEAGDNNVLSATESISFNGEYILGPGKIFTENQGSHSDYFELPVTVLPGANTATITTGADQIGWHLAILSIDSTITVGIDINPRGGPNNISLRSKGDLPVAVITTPDFDAVSVDPATVQLDGVSAARSEIKDVAGDENPDLLVYFPLPEFVNKWDENTTEAKLTGQTFDGIRIEGTDSVRIVIGGHSK